MKMGTIWKKYNFDESEKSPFAQFIQQSSYKYTKSFWSGINIDDSQDIDAIVREFRKGYTKRFVPLSEFCSATADLIQGKLMDCPDCGKQVSRRAQVCIHCGCPLSSVVEATTPSSMVSRKLVQSMSLEIRPHILPEWK